MSAQISPQGAVGWVESVGRLFLVVQTQLLVVEHLPEAQGFVGGSTTHRRVVGRQGEMKHALGMTVQFNDLRELSVLHYE